MGALLIGSLSAWSEAADGAAVSATEPGAVLEISLECPGWTENNVELGVFVSGDSFDDQLLFAGSDFHAVQVDVGKYELVPQMPRLMLTNGTVLEANTSTLLQFEAKDNESTTVSFIYEQADVSTLDDSTLISLAETSFVDEAVAEQALLQAREQVAP